MTLSSSGEDDYFSDEEIVRLLNECKVGFEAGDKSQLFRCTTLCGQFQAVIPEWAVEAQLAIRSGMRAGRIKDYNEAFGEPAEPVNTRAARVRKHAARHEVVTVLMHLRLKGFGFSASIGLRTPEGPPRIVTLRSAVALPVSRSCARPRPVEACRGLLRSFPLSSE